MQTIAAKYVTASLVLSASLAGSYVPVGPGAARADSDPSLTAGSSVSASVAAPRDDSVRRIGPGRVSFGLTATGRWQDFETRGITRNLISSGGIVVMVPGEGGRWVEAVNTAADSPALTPSAAYVAYTHEGAPGGARYPSPTPDDDADGATDEDPLDGRDNDHDGRIDEDFAAIGDEMVSVTVSPAGDTPGIEVREEAYSWSLRHIDAMVALHVTVTNTGDQALEGIRIGVNFHKQDEFVTEVQDLNGDGGQLARSLAAKGILLRGERDGVAVVMVSSRGRGEEPGWVSGETSPERSLSALLDAVTSPDYLSNAMRAPVGAPVSTQRICYAFSPNLGTIAAGESASVMLALVAVDHPNRVARKIDTALRTLVGDGSHQFIPPPLSVTRRVVWGSYEAANPGDPSGGAVITLHDPVEQGVDPLEIRSIDGKNSGTFMRSLTAEGDTRIEWHQDAPGALRGGRVALPGVMRNGDPIELILQPRQDGVEVMTAARYFARPGQLEDAFISGSPNPFRDATTIDYEVPSRLVDDTGVEVSLEGSVRTSVKVYNVAGRLVTTLVDEIQGPGRYSLQWDARNHDGRSVASGVYYVKLQIGKKYVTKRLIQLK